jgi:hypothetical protein
LSGTVANMITRWVPSILLLIAFMMLMDRYAKHASLGGNGNRDVITEISYVLSAQIVIFVAAAFAFGIL